jgi:hypothetical protein
MPRGHLIGSYRLPCPRVQSKDSISLWVAAAGKLERSSARSASSRVDKSSRREPPRAVVLAHNSSAAARGEKASAVSKVNRHSEKCRESLQL